MKKVSKIKIARTEKGLTQGDLAKVVGVSRQTISLIEAHKYNPTLKLCLSIAWALDKKLDDLFWEEKEEFD